MKTCPDSAGLQSLDNFGDNTSRPDGTAHYCRECFRRRAVESYRRRSTEAGHQLRGERVVPEGHKWCPDCSGAVPFEDFHLAPRQSGGRASYCKPCKRQRDEAKRLKRVYGLDGTQLAAMREAQNGVCLLCRERPARHVDHDPLTGRVRALLCFPCNVGLGQFGDRPVLLRRAAAYVENTRGGERRCRRASWR